MSSATSVWGAVLNYAHFLISLEMGRFHKYSFANYLSFLVFPALVGLQRIFSALFIVNTGLVKSI